MWIPVRVCIDSHHICPEMASWGGSMSDGYSFCIQFIWCFGWSKMLKCIHVPILVALHHSTDCSVVLPQCTKVDILELLQYHLSLTAKRSSGSGHTALQDFPPCQSSQSSSRPPLCRRCVHLGSSRPSWSCEPSTTH